MNTTRIPALLAVALGFGLAFYPTASGPGAGRAQAQEKPESPALDRTVLPIPEPKPVRVAELDARKAKAPPRFEVRAPAKAPNVLIVLIDDMGFGQPSAFGGPVH